MLAVDIDPLLGDVPSQYILSQNYPNPFNPSTVIRYQLPEASNVRLAVFDFLGREVAMLVNERKAVGSYEIRFDASGFSSGVYLYRLTADNPSTISGLRTELKGFVQTRMMLVIK